MALLAAVGVCAATPQASAADTPATTYLASICVTCHRVGGQEFGIPSITRRPSAEFVAALRAYRQKSRDSVIMQSAAEGLTDDEMTALAAYFEGLKSK